MLVSYTVLFASDIVVAITVPAAIGSRVPGSHVDDHCMAAAMPPVASVGAARLSTSSKGNGCSVSGQGPRGQGKGFKGFKGTGFEGKGSSFKGKGFKGKGFNGNRFKAKDAAKGFSGKGDRSGDQVVQDIKADPLSVRGDVPNKAIDDNLAVNRGSAPWLLVDRSWSGFGNEIVSPTNPRSPPPWKQLQSNGLPHTPSTCSKAFGDQIMGFVSWPCQETSQEIMAMRFPEHYRPWRPSGTMPL